MTDIIAIANLITAITDQNQTPKKTESFASQSFQFFLGFGFDQ
jgi:hypothetical protein